MADLILILAFSASLFMRVIAILGTYESEACVMCRQEPSGLAAGPCRQSRKSVTGPWSVHTHPDLGRATVSPTRQQKEKLSWKQQR